MTRDMLLDQHRAINLGLQNRNPAEAKAAVAAHLDFVELALTNQQRADRNEILAKKRYEHEAEK
jgi:GntR family transcriptional repressor for pyruvate dehydrogenase complex